MNSHPASTLTLTGTVEIRLASPEDTLLHKLVWFRLGGELSDRQWNDVRGMLEVQRDVLDAEYLAEWSKVLGVHDLLERAFA